MVCVSEIPLVGKALDRIYDAIIDATFRGLRYMCCYKSFVENLDSQLVKVNIQHADVSRRIEAEKANGKVIKDHVLEWQEKVEESNRRRDELLTQELSCNCFGVMRFPIPLNRLQLGREAAHEEKNVAELTASGEKLLANETAHLPADRNMPICDTTYQKFDSREEAYGKLWESLVKEDGHPIIGIYGMPGVGKTRMMEQAWKDAKDENVFDKVTRANVGGENFDVITLQKQLAASLGCHFESADDVSSRALQLKNSISNGGKTLVVLDDVWDEISLQNIGIPLGDDISKGCKILLTSRREDVCLLNHCEDPIKIEPLSGGEAWDMFRNTVGTSKVESLEDKSLAKKVCKECAGLPLLIHAVGHALMHATEESWKDTFYQLQNCNFEDIDRIPPRVYTGIKLSFDKLPNAEITCLLFCSLFPEDAEIQIKMLEDFAKGSQLRSRNVKGLVDKLKSSSLLLEGKTPRTVKMHDIIRDVARSVAARVQEYAFLLVRGDWRLPVIIDDYSSRRVLQIVDSGNFHFPAGILCPDVHTFWLESNNNPQQFPNSFLEGMGNLKNLVLKGMHGFPEQMYIQTFDKLTVLILDDCGLSETSLTVIPESLEIIRIYKCRIPNALDLSKLKSLRKLEVLCDKEIEMVKNGISTLPTTLEELHIPGGFRIRDAEGNLSVLVSSELNKLSKLTSLNIRLEDSNSCPNENIVANLLDFKIDVCNGWYSFYSSLDIYTRSVAFMNTSIEGGGQLLVERAQEVALDHVKGSSLCFTNRNREAYSDLKRLWIKSCEEMEHVVAWKPEYEIQQSQSITSFSKLTELDISYCSGFKYLFSASVAKCLEQLEILYIEYCPRLEVVIRNESAIDREIIIFPKLKYLKLHYLESLRRFYGESRANNTSIPSGSDSLFDGMVAFPVLETLDISNLIITEIWEKNYYSNDSFCQLKYLTIWGFYYLKFAIPVAMLPTFQNLENLKIYYCYSMASEVESSSNECGNGEQTFVALRSIEFYGMPVLTKIMLNSGRNLCPNLEELSIEKCKSLRNVFLPSVAKHLKHLQRLYISRCKMMNEIIGIEETEKGQNYIFDFPQMTELRLRSLPNFKSFCFGQSAEASQHHSYLDPKVLFPKLVELEFHVKTIKLDEIELGGDDSTTGIWKLVVHCDNKVQLPSTWQLQFPNIEELSFRNCWWSGNIMEAFSNLKKLSLHSFDDLEHLAFISRYEIQQSRPLTLFPKLTSLVIVSCLGLKYLFCASVAKSLVQLQELRVENCPTLEVVIRNERNGVIPKFPKLKKLTLVNLESLGRFYGEHRNRSSSSTTIIETAAISPAESESLFDRMVIFPALEKLRIQSLKTSEIWGENSYKNNSFCQLKVLEIESCHNLEFAIRLPMLEILRHLEELNICKCDSTLEVVIRNESATDEVIVKFPKLKSLMLMELPSLRRFYGGTKATSSSSSTITDNTATASSGSHSLFDEMVEFPALETLSIQSLKISEIWGTICYNDNSFSELKVLTIKNCHNLEFAIPLAMLPTFQNLGELDIRECESMTSEVESSSSSSSNECLPQLVSLEYIHLIKMPGLTQTGLNSRRNLYPNLCRLSVIDCKSLKSAELYSKAQIVVYLSDAQVEDGE